MYLSVMMLFIILGGEAATSVRAEPEPQVIPLMLQDHPFTQGEDLSLEVVYRAGSNGREVFYEPGERVWWIQDQAVAVLGATGLPLPQKVRQRATVWVDLVHAGELIGTYEVFPRRDGVAIRSGEHLLDKLGVLLPGVDASYLSQVAHFLAGNLATLDVVGTSYSVAGIGSVIDSSGDWVGGRLETASPGESVFVGFGSGTADNGAMNRNVALGVRALGVNDSGAWNAAVGFEAMASNLAGSVNTALGYHALTNNTSGGENLACGASALFNNTTGSQNTAVGHAALWRITNGNFNTAVGQSAMENTITGSGNTALGIAALRQSDGDNNTGLGQSALYGNGGNLNTAVGYLSLLSNQGGSNTAVGAEAMRNNGTGGAMTAVGYGALHENDDGYKNTAIGFRALYSNVSGSENTAVGFEALYNDDHNPVFVGNTAVGFHALNANQDGYGNAALGHRALRFNVGGYGNSAFGSAALATNTNGDSNTACGNHALFQSTANSNTAVGSYTLYENKTGNNNSALGGHAGPGFQLSNLANTTAIGFATDVTASNQIRLGSSSVTSIGGQVSWTTLSDGRFKREVQDEVLGLEFIKALRPVTYRVDRDAVDAFLQVPMEERASKRIPLSSVTSGFIAQDVAEAAKRLGCEFSGVDAPPNSRTPFGMRYAEFVAPLVRAVQEQQAIIDELTARIEILEVAH